MRIIHIQELQGLQLPQGNGALLQEIHEGLEDRLPLGHDGFVQAPKHLLAWHGQVQCWTDFLIEKVQKGPPKLRTEMTRCENDEGKRKEKKEEP